MRFLHTSDWHLGRLFHGTHLTGDQAHLLDQLVDLAAGSRLDAVLISGDIYDRAVPPTDAVHLLDDTLTRIVEGAGIPVVLIAGNHDSPDRLGFGSRLLAARGLHLFGALDAGPQGVPLADDHGPVRIDVVPYAEPSVVRERLGLDAVHDHDAAMRAILDGLRGSGAGGKAKGGKTGPGGRPRRILMAHAFVAGGSVSDSERPLSVGGAGTVGADAFDGFDYVALGHLHRPQAVGRETLSYSGSLFKYSFSEAEHEKSVSLVEMDAGGGCRIDRVALTPRRDVRRIEGTLQDLLRGPASGESRDDYLEVTLLDKQAVLDPMGKLREIYPNAMDLKFPEAGGGRGGASAGDHRKVGEAELFGDFFREVTGDDLTGEEAEEFGRIVDAMHAEEREAAGGRGGSRNDGVSEPPAADPEAAR